MKYVLLAVLLQIVGPFYFGFDKWANIIQYTSGFVMIYAGWHFFYIHKPQLKSLHDKFDELIGSDENV